MAFQDRSTQQARGRRLKIRGARKFRPARVLAISFALAILAGTLLFLLPASTRSGHNSVVDALFRAASAICVTGLIIHDTPTHLTTFGQVINIILVQLGGLGIMTFSTLVLLVAGKTVSIQDRIIIQQGFHHSASKDVKSLIKNIFVFTLTIELVGTLLFFFRWMKTYPFLKGIYFSLFHSISAFCNAGFSLFSNSFESYRQDIWINLTLCLLIIFGGVGFLVIQEVKDAVTGFLRKKRIRVSLHTKMVLLMTGALIFFPTVVFFLIEKNQAFQAYSVKEALLASLFQVVTPRTAGFNTIPLSPLRHASVFLFFGLMFIGASPGSTGGGVKTSTVGVLAAFLKSKITARETINLFYRTLPLDLVTRAFTVVMLSLVVIFLSSFVILLAQPEFHMQEVFFETFSAFGTVGLSLGITPKLNTLSKLVIILTMYIGRIGPLTMLYAFSRQRAYGRYEYAEETVMIG